MRIRFVISLLVVILGMLSIAALAATKIECNESNSLICDESARTPAPGERHYEMPRADNSAAPADNSYSPPCELRDGDCHPCQRYCDAKALNYHGITVAQDRWAVMASEAALQSVENGGGPFGAVILQIDDATGDIIRYWVNHNKVVEKSDPTAHAEVSTIRAATSQLGVIDLGNIKKSESKLPQPGETSHCVIYSSGEPCPMCMAAIYWANIQQTIFCSTVYDAAAPGVNFGDFFIYNEFGKKYIDRKMVVRRSNNDNALDAFNYYKRTPCARYGEDTCTN